MIFNGGDATNGGFFRRTPVPPRQSGIMALKKIKFLEGWGVLLKSQKKLEGICD